MSEEDICRTCGQTLGWHQENNPQHPFRDNGDLLPDGLGKKDQQKKLKTRVEVRDWPHDPVLRIALVNKGILTMADIEAAEQSMREAAENGNVVRLSRPEVGSGDGSDVESGDGESAKGMLRHPSQQ